MRHSSPLPFRIVTCSPQKRRAVRKPQIKLFTLAQILSRNYAQVLKDAGVTHYSEIVAACLAKQVAVRAGHLSSE